MRGTKSLKSNDPSPKPSVYSFLPSEPKPKKETVYNEKTAVAPLLEGKTVLVKGVGNSMTPILLSGQTVLCEPITPDIVLKKGDIVLCKVKGQTFMHKITGIRNKGTMYQISNNHGYVNGWTSRDKIYGRYIKES